MPAALRSLPPPNKKRKIQKDNGLAANITILEQQLVAAVSSNASLNPLADLLDLTLTAKTAPDTSKGIYSLYRVLVTVITSGKLNASGTEEAKVVKAWLWERMNSYVVFLSGLLKDEEKTLRVREG